MELGQERVAHLLHRGSTFSRIQPSPTAPPAGYQVSKHVSLWGTSKPVLFCLSVRKMGVKGGLGEEGQHKEQGVHL